MRRRGRAGRLGLGVCAIVALAATSLGSSVQAAGARPQVVGSSVAPSPLAAQQPITLNDNGGWSWFQDQRAIFTSDDRLLVGSVPNPAGANGLARAATIEATTYDIRTSRTSVDRVQAGLGNDDHDAPAFIETLPGRVVAAWSGHSAEAAVHVATEDADSLTWDQPAPIPRPNTVSAMKVTYSNLISLSAENHGRGRLYDFYRGEGANPNLLVSDDEGRSWRYGGRLFAEPNQRPYVRYSGHGTNRIDFIASQGHPFDVNGNSVRAGYVQNGEVHGTNGSLLGPLNGSVRFDQLTPVMSGTPSPLGGASDADAWLADIEQDGAGRPVAALSVRLPTAPAAAGTGRYDHRYFIGRWNGTRWVLHQAAFAGGELYSGQPDYTGTAAIDPADPNHLFISTNVNPSTGASVISSADGRPHWEVYEGRSADSGASWSWTAVTSNSAADNIRPDVVAGPHGDWALLWLRGQYPNFIRYNLKVMGIVRATPTSVARVTPTRVGGTATVIAGRFGGDGHDDLFVSGPGAAGDGFVLAGVPRRRLVAKPFRQPYTFSALDPDASGRDTLLAVPSNPLAPVSTFRLNADTSITTGLLERPPRTQPVVADVDGDGRDDILWYGPGAIPDQLWHAQPRGGYRVQTVTVRGNYRPVVADVDGDGRDDIIWYSPGTGTDWIWRSRPLGGHDNRAINVKGDYHPVAGDFNGDGRSEILWNAPGGAPDYEWHFTSTGGIVTTRVALPATAQPAIGDFNGDRRDDIFWNASGDTPDVTWLSGVRPT